MIPNTASLGFYTDYSGFENYLKIKDTRDITINRHLRTLRRISQELKNLSVDEIKKYFDGCKLNGNSGSTLNGYITTVRLYAQYKKLGMDLIKYPLYPRKQTQVRQTFSDDEIEAFLNAPQRKWQSRQSWKAWNCFWALLAFCALRPSEARQLLKSDIDIGNRQIVLRAEITKTNQFSTIPLFPNIMPLIEQHVFQLVGNVLFPSPKLEGKGSKDGFLTQRGWDTDFQARLQQCGIEKRPGLVPYSFRHSCATRWISNDMSFYKVRRLMRHAKLEQTLVYEHMTSGHLVNSVLKYDPLVRKYAKPIHILEAFEEAISNYKLENDIRFSEEFKKDLREVIYKEKKRMREENVATLKPQNTL